MGSLMLINKAEPIAMSAYPLKSKYSWKVYDKDVAHASKKFRIVAISNPAVAQTAKVSAITTFLNKPMIKISRHLKLEKAILAHPHYIIILR